MVRKSRAYHLVAVEETDYLLATLARRFPHIDIWGGCCGTWDTHLSEIAREVRAARGRP